MLVGPHELADHLRVTFDSSTASQAEQLLEMVEHEVQGYCRDVLFHQVIDDEVRLDGVAEQYLRLPGRPVESVASVEIDGVATTDYTLVGSRLHRYGGWQGIAIDVVYTHGFVDVPPVVRRVVLYAAARMWPNPEQTMQKKRGEYSASFGSSTTETSGLTTWERALLRSSGLRAVVG
jgi:hypothetical protein